MSLIETGIINVLKPQDFTSHDCVAIMRGVLGLKRVGHTGTLDPMATGVLPILLGRATALSSLMLDADKKYIARVKLGVITDTDVRITEGKTLRGTETMPFMINKGKVV